MPLQALVPHLHKAATRPARRARAAGTSESDPQYSIVVKRVQAAWSMPQAAQIAALLAATFQVEAGGPELSRAQQVGRLLRCVADLQLTAAQLGPQYTTLLAYPRGSSELAGAACLSPGLYCGGPAEPLHAGRMVATVTNMAVGAAHRRRGLGAQLLRACEAEAARLDPPAQLLALTVYRSNDQAQRRALPPALVFCWEPCCNA
jgi:ribosomal protein S18 acetylase RimI-like enzyme